MLLRYLVRAAALSVLFVDRPSVGWPKGVYSVSRPILDDNIGLRAYVEIGWRPKSVLQVNKVSYEVRAARCSGEENPGEEEDAGEAAHGSTPVSYPHQRRWCHGS